MNYLAVMPECRRQGLGRAMMEEAKRLLTKENCPKINLQVRSSNKAVMAFYQSIGYMEDDVVSFGLRIEKDA